MKISLVFKCFVSLMMCMSSMILLSQENLGYIYSHHLAGTPDTVYLESNGIPQIISYPHSISEGSAMHRTYMGSGLWEFVFDPGLGWTGEDSYTVEYFGPGQFPGFWPPKYTSVVLRTDHSIISAKDDHVIMENGQTSITVDVMANDVHTESVTWIDMTSQESNCTATLNSDSDIVIDVDPLFVGMAYVTYVIRDSLGASDMGKVTVKVNGGQVNMTDTLSFHLINERPLTIILDQSGYSLDLSNEAVLGEVTSLGDDRFLYTPFEHISGPDDFLLINGSDSKLVEITVIDLPNEVGFVVDDFVVTSSGNTVQFDVLVNDRKRSFPLVDYSPELVRDTLGIFSYTAPAGVVGEYQYYYTVYNGFEHQTATVTIKIDNYVPAQFSYDLHALENTAMALEYDVAISDYSISVLSAPLHGTLDIYQGLDTVQIGCNAVVGRELQIYTPDPDYTGLDNFDVEYCVDNNPCFVLKVDVDVMENLQDSLCHCVGDCVWSGDANDDGRVTIADILPVALYMGEKGESRADINYNFRNGQHAADWGETIGNSHCDIKHIDSDGDGYITSDDTTAISTYFNEVHEYVPFEILGLKNYPFYLLPQETELDSGDLAVIDIIIGNAEYPVVDLHGLAFNISINSAFVDSSSLNVHFFENDWFAYNSPSIQLSKQPVDGSIHAAFSRTGGKSISGYGIIGQVTFIVEDEAMGFRIEEGENLPFTISLSEGSGMDGNGNAIGLPSAETTMFLRPPSKATQGPISEADVVVYPNPAQDHINIHLNAEDHIRSVNVVDVLGRSVDFLDNLSDDSFVLPITSYPTGMYYMHIRTDHGYITKTFEVVRR